MLLAVLLLSLLYFVFNMREEASQRLSSLTRESDAAAVKMRVLQKSNQDLLAAQKADGESLQKLKAEMEANKAAQQYFAGAGIDAVRDVKMLTAALPDQASYTTINTTRTGLNVNGQAATPADVFQIIEWLGADSQVAEARIVTIGASPSKEKEGVTFTLDIKKK